MSYLAWIGETDINIFDRRGHLVESVPTPDTVTATGTYLVGFACLYDVLDDDDAIFVGGQGRHTVTAWLARSYGIVMRPVVKQEDSSVQSFGGVVYKVEEIDDQERTDEHC